MKPLAVFSVNSNPDYMFLAPIVAKSWELQGWDIQIIAVDIPIRNYGLMNSVTHKYATILQYGDKPLSKLNPALFTQCARMYSWRIIPHPPDRYCIISDADMFIGSSFLNRDFDKVNIFGHDLTGYGQIPMCYVGMPAGKWAEIMGRSGMLKDLFDYTQIETEDWYKAWGSDQDIITAKLKNYGYENINFIPRGNDPNNDSLPTGRLDRHNWKYPSTEIHDCHLLRNPTDPDNFNKIKEMCNRVYPKADWLWLDDYYQRFKSIKNE